MLSRSTEKLVRKLSSKKYRWQLRLFIAEGRKVVQELLDEGVPYAHIFTKEGAAFSHPQAVVLSAADFAKISQLSTADEVLAVFKFPQIEAEPGGTTLVLDKINDPGNLGTIIRTCDWFGISTVYCTTGTADVYNAKTIQSTMGSVARVELQYADEQQIYEKLNAQGYSFWCADMAGESIGTSTPPGRLALVMGSESHGPSDFWKQRSHRVTIPRKGNSKTESLNVATATAIILGHISLGR